MSIYLPDESESVPPLAKRCRDATEPSGRCRFSGTCNASRQRLQSVVLQHTGVACPWYVTMAQAKACEAEP